METIITDNNFENLIGKGYEGSVYNFDDNNVIKVVNDFNENKINKIKLLHDIKLENYIFPNKLVSLDDGTLIGYTMEKVNTNGLKDLQNNINSNITLDKKIKYLKNLEKNLIKAHKIGMTIVDLNYSNFLVNEDDKIIMIDTDNFTYKDYKTDNFPVLYSMLYRSKISSEITPNMDKFSFTMKLLEYLCDESILQFDLINYHPYRKDLEKFVNSLDIPLDVKSMILHNISDDQDKVYFGNTLNKLSSNKTHIYKK